MSSLSNNPTFLGAIKFVVWTAISMALMVTTRYYFYVVLALAAMYFAISKRTGLAISLYIAMTSINMVNPLVIPRFGYASIISRLSVMAVATVLVSAAMSRKGKCRVPIGTLLVYLAVAFLLSFNSYAPVISYLKVANIFIFLAAIYWGMQNLDGRTDQLVIIRYALLGMFLVFVYGSLATLPFPAVAYLTSLRHEIRVGGVEYATAVFHSSNSMNLFAGLTSHSQVLGTLLSCIFASTCCDAFVVDKRMDILHLLIIAPIPIMQYMTHSRASLFTLLVFVVSLVMYLLPRLKMIASAKSRVVAIVIIGLLALSILGGYYEIRDQRLTKWIRKTQDVAGDQRTLGDAITASRMGTVELNMRDFRSSPIFGTGFQTMEWHREALASGAISIFSAPIEKGILPLMVLGETGIIGGVVFLGFLLSFTAVCIKKRYIATLVLFIVFFATNLAEATFFSPSSAGGVLWLITVCAGFFYDLLAKAQRKQLGPPMAVQYQYPMPGPSQIDSSHRLGNRINGVTR